MDEHALRVLEFPAVLRLVAAETAFSVGRERVLAMRPLTSFEEVVREQRLTAEMTELRRQGIDVPFAGAADIRPHIRSAAIAQALEPSDLQECAQTLGTAFKARRLLEGLRDRVPELAGISDAIADFRRLSDLVDESIGPRGEVLDAASEALATVRRELRVAQDRVEQRAQAALADAIRRGIAQEPLLTDRNGRKVIPIKADFRGAMKGIVHDVSSSGATVFFEPFSLVEAGNRVRELEVAEEREVRRVLQRLSALIGEREEEATASVEALGALDMVSARCRYGVRMKAQLPPPGDPESWLRGAGSMNIVRGRHPLLSGEVVPTGIDLEGDGTGVLITGPNTGGKTVALKTLGLLTLMAQAGIPVPCDEGSRFRVFGSIFADIGDEQSIQQSLSTFSSHMRQISAILEQAQPSTLVLLDELGAGTDPTEGSALSRAVLEALLDRGCAIVATTHHAELKAFAQADPRLRNASVEFDVETLSPTYHLSIGVPGQSNAIAIARRLGLPAPILERASEQVSPEHVELEQLLADIRSQRASAAESRELEESAREEAEGLRLDLARQMDQFEREKADLLDSARREAEEIVARMRREADGLRRRAGNRSFDPAEAERTLERLDADLGELNRGATEARRRRTAAAVPAVEAGDRLEVHGIPQQGEALGSVGEDGRVEVQFGSLRMKVSVDRIDRIERGGSEVEAAESSRPAIERGPAVPVDLDLRGRRADEAVESVDGYLDAAYRGGMPFIRIIHGKGTGALRAAVRELLRGHPLVKSYQSAPANEGGDGVTVAVLAG